MPPWRHPREVSDAVATQQQVSNVDLVQLHRLCTSYLSSKAIFSAMELGVFDALEDGPETAEELARRLGLGERATRALLLALLGDGIVTRDDGRYANSRVTRRFLVRSSPAYFGGFTEHQDTHFAKFARLTDVVKEDGPITAPVAFKADGRPTAGPPPEVVRRWVEASAASALLQADELTSRAPLGTHRHLVDLGCGAAAYSLAFARANPNLRVTAVEQPFVAESLRQRVSAAGLDAQVEVRPGDIFTDQFPECDVALLSHVLDGWSRERARALIRHIHGWLEAGGELLVHAHFPSRATVPFAHQLGLILLVNNPHGGEVHDEALTCRWLTEEGFRITEVSVVSPISSLVRATAERTA